MPYQQNRVYPPEQKLKAVREYLSGAGSLEEISKKYKLRNDRQLHNWIKVYNAHGTFNSAKFSGGGSYMKQRRETTQAQIENEQVADKIEKIHSESPDKGA
ncbi:transposase [bacterium 210917-SL.2.15]|nr:transposase [bacterium 210917-SL.2.15]